MKHNVLNKICILFKGLLIASFFAACSTAFASGVSCGISCGTIAQPIYQSYSWGHVNGSVFDGSITGNVSPTGYYSVPVAINMNAYMSTVTTPNTTFQAQAITLPSGEKVLKVYVYTKSSYAPNGDSGTFVFDDSTGALISGSTTTLDRLRTEVEEGDPRLIAAIGAIPQSFWSDIGQAVGCAAAMVADTAVAVMYFDPATSAATSVFLLSGGATFLYRATTVAC